MANRRQRLRRTLVAAAFLLFQIRLLHLFMSPVLPIVAAWRGILAVSVVTYGVLFLASLVLGRAFCAWLCPGTAIQELAHAVIKRPAKGGRRDRIKYAICGLWTASLVLAAVHAGGLRRFDPFFGTGVGPGPPGWLLRFGAFLLIVPLAALFGRWASCHYLCWIAPFMILGTRIKDRFGWPSLHLRADPAACLACASCNQTCPMSLDVSAMAARGSMRNDECVLCGNCVDHCPADAIRFAFSRRIVDETARRTVPGTCGTRPSRPGAHPPREGNIAQVNHHAGQWTVYATPRTAGESAQRATNGTFFPAH